MPSSDAPKRRSSDDPPGSGTTRILIVDDSTADIGMMLRYLGEFDDALIETASESGQAEDLLRNSTFDIILLDYRMPGMSGLDYLEVVRRRDPDVGIVMTTAFSDEKIAIKAIRRRVDDFLRKEDMTRESVTETVESLIGRVRRRRSATIDAITGLYCASALKQRLSEACEKLRANGDEFCLIMLDLAQFRDVNERYGHATGDRVLRRVATILPDALRTGDYAARYQDDEFCVVAPNTDEHKAIALAERLRECIRRIEFDYGDGQFSIDCAVGLAHFRNRAPESVDAVVQSAYTAMHKAQASASGRVQVSRNHGGTVAPGEPNH